MRLECLRSRQVKALLSRKLLRMLNPTATIQDTVGLALKYSTRVIKVSRFTSTPKTPTRANFQKRPAEGTYQKRLAMCARYSSPWAKFAFDTPAFRAWKFSGASTTLSSGAQTRTSSSILNPVGRNWMPEMAVFLTRKKPLKGSLVFLASLKTIWARDLVPTETALRNSPERPS